MAEPLSFQERLTWHAESGEIRDGAVRYMLIRPDALMAVFAGLASAPRALALDMFRQAVLTFGSRSAAKYNADATSPLIDVVAATAPQLGWGRWSVERIDGGYRVVVMNSPFAAGFGASDLPVCAPIAGMLQAVGTIMGGDASVAHETHCAAVHGDRCEFRMIPGDAK